MAKWKVTSWQEHSVPKVYNLKINLISEYKEATQNTSITVEIFLKSVISYLASLENNFSAFRRHIVLAALIPGFSQLH